MIINNNNNNNDNNNNSNNNNNSSDNVYISLANMMDGILLIKRKLCILRKEKTLNE